MLRFSGGWVADWVGGWVGGLLVAGWRLVGEWLSWRLAAVCNMAAGWLPAGGWLENG